MTAADLLIELRALGISVSRDGEDLIVSSQSGLLTPELRSELKEYESELLALLKEESRGGGGPIAGLSPAGFRDHAPLSSSQAQVWAIEQLSVGDSAYHTHVGLDLSGPLDRDILRRSLTELRRRHEVLRTRFVEEDGEPWAEVTELTDSIIAEVDLTGAGSRERDLEELIRLDVQRPFDLETGQLLRATLFALAPEEHVLLLVIHNIAADDASLRILQKELFAHYEASLCGECEGMRVSDHREHSFRSNLNQ